MLNQYSVITQRSMIWLGESVVTDFTAVTHLIEISILCVCVCLRVCEYTPWDSAVVSASHLVTWWRAGQLWVVCKKVSWLSKQPGGVCACLCVCLIRPLSVCLCVCIRIWETVLPFCSWNCSGFWVMADSTHSHTHTHSSLPVNLPQLPWPPPGQCIQRYHGDVSVF